MRSPVLLAGTTLLVIGGSSGIGLETARRAREEGAAVIITARDPEEVHRAGLELQASIAAFDATDFQRLGRFFEGLPGPVDHVLVTGPGRHEGSSAKYDVEGARREVDAHLLLPLQVAREAATRVRPAGTLIFTGCIDGVGSPGGPPFLSAITAALSVITKSLADELAPIRVNLVATGFVDTPRPAAVLVDGLEGRRQELGVSLRRAICPADVAALAIHLMTNTAVTGATFHIDGGQRLVEMHP